MKYRKSILKNYLISINVEKILFMTFSILFTSLIIAQAVLVTGELESFLGVNSRIEGSPIKKEEFLFKEGNLVLELISDNKKAYSNTIGHYVYILVNGEEVSSFIKNQISLDVKNGDVIEIDSTKTNNPVDVSIRSKSPNITMDDINKKYRINSQVKKIIKVKIE